MRRLDEVVMSLGSRRAPGVIYATAPWTASSMAMVQDPGSVVGAPNDMASLVDVDLAHEYLRSWSSWQTVRPQADALLDALLAFVGHPPDLGQLPPVAAVRGADFRVTTQSGRGFDDPTEDLLYELFLEMEAGADLFLVVQRLSDARGQAFVHALRDDDGSYILEQGDGSGQMQLGTVKPSMPWAHLAVCDWMFRGVDVARR